MTETDTDVTPEPIIPGEEDGVTSAISTSAGSIIQYSKGDKLAYAGIMFYLIASMIGVFWFILDIWAKKYSLFDKIGYGSVLGPSHDPRQIFQLMLYGMAGGWLGGVISAALSLQQHYASPVDNMGDLEKQERTRFHKAWWSRWIWGPWYGMGLALIVIALVRSGILVFAASSTVDNVATATEKFATFGLGALVGLSSKDVIEKLIKALKTWLRVEEPETPKLEIKAEGGKKETCYGGDVIIFKIDSKIPVTWEIDPQGSDVGTITNGIFRPADAPSNGTPEKRTVIVTATTKANSDRSSSVSFVLKKPPGS